MHPRGGAPHKRKTPLAGGASQDTKHIESVEDGIDLGSIRQGAILFLADLRRPRSRLRIRQTFCGPHLKPIRKKLLKLRGPLVAAVCLRGVSACGVRSFTEDRLESEVLAFEFACRAGRVSGGALVMHSVDEALRPRIDAAVASTWVCGGTA